MPLVSVFVTVEIQGRCPYLLPFILSTLNIIVRRSVIASTKMHSAQDRLEDTTDPDVTACPRRCLGRRKSKFQPARCNTSRHDITWSEPKQLTVDRQANLAETTTFLSPVFFNRAIVFPASK